MLMIISTFRKLSTCNQPFLELYTGKSTHATCGNHLETNRGLSSQIYLSFRQTEVDSQFRFPPDGDVSVEMKLLLQLQSLVVCVNYPVFLLRSRFTCEDDEKQNTMHWGVFFFFFCSHVAFAEASTRTGETASRRPGTGLICSKHLYSPGLKSTSLALVCRYANVAVLSRFDNCTTVNFKEPARRSASGKETRGAGARKTGRGAAAFCVKHPKTALGSA